MKVIFINPRKRSAAHRFLKFESYLQSKTEIEKMLNATSLKCIPLSEKDRLFVDFKVSENYECSFILNSIPGMVPIFGNAILASWNLEDDIRIQLKEMRADLWFFGERYSKKISQRILRQQQPVPPDEQMMGKTIRVERKAKFAIIARKIVNKPKKKYFPAGRH